MHVVGAELADSYRTHKSTAPDDGTLLLFSIIIIKDIYIPVAQVGKGHKCATSAEMAVWLSRQLNRNVFGKVSAVTPLDRIATLRPQLQPVLV